MYANLCYNGTHKFQGAYRKCRNPVDEFHFVASHLGHYICHIGARQSVWPPQVQHQLHSTICMFGNEKLYNSHDICYKYGASKLVHQKFPLSITCRKHPVYPLERERERHTHTNTNTHKAKQSNNHYSDMNQSVRKILKPQKLYFNQLNPS